MAKPTHKSAPKIVAASQSTFLKSQGLCQIVLFQKTRLWGGSFFVAKSCIKTELFRSAPFCCMFLATFLEKSLKVAQNGENHPQISPQKSCRLTKHFFEIPRSLSSRPLSKNPFVGRQLFLWPKPVLKQNFLNQPRFAVCF